MRPPERLLVLTPRRWPIRWRLAAVSAGLTLIILVVFALVVGRLVSNRLQADFNDEVRDTAARLAFDFGTRQNPAPSDLRELSPAPGSATIRIVTPVGSKPTRGAPDIGWTQPGDLRTVGSLRVATAPIPNSSAPPSILQYGRSTSNLDATINRLWLFLGLGVLGGTVLAALTGMAVAGRAMRPIAALTATAREVAFTRDPSRRIPEPERDDEVGELARTIEQMLRQLDAARGETEQMMQLQRDFVADASHELGRRSPASWRTSSCSRSGWRKRMTMMARAPKWSTPPCAPRGA
jgi:two-component system OmpR family sensor kinase